MSRGSHEALACAALVLSGADSNSHRIVRVLTEGDRLIPAIALHARRTRKGRSSQSAALQPLSLVDAALAVTPTRDLATLKRAAIIEPFVGLKGDLKRLALATTMAEVVLHLVAEHGQEPGAFQLLLRAWRHLNRAEVVADESLLLLFELRMLTLAGLLPPIDALGLPVDATARLIVWADRSAPYASVAAPYLAEVAACLEGFIADASGRRLKSRPFTTEMMGR